MDTQRPIIVFSDIHGNVNNMLQFKEALRGFNYSKAYCLGDIIHKGKTFDENRAISLVREMDVVCVRGNHEDYPLDSQRISSENVEFVANLESSICEGDLLFSHTSLNGPDKRLREDTDFLSEGKCVVEQFPKVKFAFYGHEHRPTIVKYDPTRRSVENICEITNPYEDKSIYLINPGSLGASHVENCFSVFDKKEGSVKIIALKELIDMSDSRYLLTKFEEWMPYLLGGKSSWMSLKDEAEELKNRKDSSKVREIIQNLNEFESHDKRDIRDYLDLTLKLSKAFAQFATKDVLKYYCVIHPSEVRNNILTAKKASVKGVDVYLKEQKIVN